MTQSQSFQLDCIPQRKKRTPFKLLIYSDNGVGKSTFAAKSPHAVFLDLEGNIDHLYIPRQPLLRWHEVMEFLDFLLKENHSFKTAVIDSLGALEQEIWVHVCQGSGAAFIGDQKALPYGSGYILAQDCWKEFLKKLERLRSDKEMSVILIGHAAVHRCENPLTENFDRFELRIHAKAAGLLCDWCHCIFLAVNELFVKHEKEDFGKVSQKGRHTDRG